MFAKLEQKWNAFQAVRAEYKKLRVLEEIALDKVARLRANITTEFMGGRQLAGRWVACGATDAVYTGYRRRSKPSCVMLNTDDWLVDSDGRDISVGESMAYEVYCRPFKDGVVAQNLVACECAKCDCSYNTANRLFVSALNEYRDLRNRRCGFWKSHIKLK